MLENNWSQFGESDVREEIIAPLLARLNYKTGSDNNIIRELSLKYEKSYLGHKKPQKDWPLRGKADYVCEVNRKIRWTIEAKSPNIEISEDDIDQAYSYARHPEVRAVYYCICNGRELRILLTRNAPGTKPILFLKYEDLYTNVHAIESLLSPKSILNNHQEPQPDFDKPIGPGLRSLARITNGQVVFQTSIPDLAVIQGYTVYIINGAIQRQSSRGLVAFLDSVSPYESFQKLNERLGVARLEITSEDAVLSTVSAQPTVFQSQHIIKLAKGEKLPDFRTGVESELPMNLTCDVSTEAKGFLKDNSFTGSFTAEYFYREINVRLKTLGNFEMHVI